jgi:SulP family sulfate permease
MKHAAQHRWRAWRDIALVEALKGYRRSDLRADLMAGLTVGIVAVPLAMALAIASGVPPQYGLYTSIVAGAIIALTGGSRYSISGPTAAFVVILLPITEQYGLGGLLLTTVMAGAVMVVMGLAKMGRLIQFIPYPVTTGFTAGIAVVIATLQIKDFLGLETGAMPSHFTEKIAVLVSSLPSAHWPDLLIGSLTLAVLLLWPRLKSRLPGHLAALLVGSLAAWLLARIWPEFSVATIGSRFTYISDGVEGHGIPALPPLPLLPWQLPGADGQPLQLSWQLLRELLPSAFTVAMLGAIESLLCAVVADGLAGSKHKPNSELIGQGLGNLIAPFFGGIPATAAIARTATNIRAGGRSPLASLIHAGVVLLAVVSLAELLGYVPMAALAALLLVVAWNMSEAKHFVHILRVAPRCDVVVLLTCFGLTVVFDMVIAVGTGVVLASILFIRRMTAMSGVEMVEPQAHQHLADLPSQVAVYDVNGPLFFGAAEKALAALQQINSAVSVVILDMRDVPMMDMTGIVALQSLLDNLRQRRVRVVIANLQPRIEQKLSRAGIAPEAAELAFCRDLGQAREAALALLPQR